MFSEVIQQNLQFLDSSTQSVCINLHYVSKKELLNIYNRKRKI